MALISKIVSLEVGLGHHWLLSVLNLIRVALDALSIGLYILGRKILLGSWGCILHHLLSLLLVSLREKLFRRDSVVRGFVWRAFWREPKLLVKSFSKLLQFGQPLAQIKILEVASSVGILELAIRILIKVDALKILKIYIIDVRIFLLHVVNVTPFKEFITRCPALLVQEQLLRVISPRSGSPLIKGHLSRLGFFEF